jgi:hypothetical protein
MFIQFGEYSQTHYLDYNTDSGKLSITFNGGREQVTLHGDETTVFLTLMRIFLARHDREM